MKPSTALSLVILCTFFSCKDDITIEGLWMVKSVQVGEEEMTPNARWTRFNADLTQESGNGRFQHSYGTWTLNEKTNQLKIDNSNGLIDSNEPFEISINDDEMIWQRQEEGQAVKVILERISQLPETYGDRILGLWQLEEATTNGRYFSESKNRELKDYVFFRWDKRFIIQSDQGRINGVYNVHGHKPEVELIPYGEPLKRDFWTIQFTDNEIILELLNSDTTVIRKFKRINRFPE